MIDLGHSVSKAGDFANLTVYLRAEDRGPVYAVSFKNQEWLSGFSRHTAAALGTLFLALPVTFIGIDYGAEIGIPWYVTVLAALAIVSVVFKQCSNPHLIDRRIELDLARNQLNVLRGETVEISQPLNQLSNLTVDAHPQAEARRNERMERGEKGLKPEEKQHSLYGWFGAKGALRVLLLSRYEWPHQNSLFEVRQAIQFARDHAAAMMAGATGTGQGTAGPDGGGAAEDMNPPLD